MQDGDLYNVNPGPNPIYAEFLNTNGRVGFRLTNKYGAGLLFEKSAMQRLLPLLEEALTLKEQNVEPSE